MKDVVFQGGRVKHKARPRPCSEWFVALCGKRGKQSTTVDPSTKALCAGCATKVNQRTES